MEIFEELYSIDVNDRVEKKKTGGAELSYLSWAWAWAEVKKKYPLAKYTIERYENNLPYVNDPVTGYMVFTTVTIEEVTHEMWLPVMDGTNKAMKSEAYEYTTKFGKKKVEAATMFDINKTIMRCLVKNLAMHGLGLYIYAGEDLPESDEPPTKPQGKPVSTPKPQTSNYTPKTETKPTTAVSSENNGLITTAQAKRLFAISGGNSELVRMILTSHGYSSSKDIKTTDYEMLANEVTKAVSASKEG